MDEVEPIGLGARDSLRLEAGLCLYGHDIDLTTSPVEADLVWSISKRRREEGGFVGADVVQRQLAEGPKRKRVGILPEGRAPAREGTEILAKDGTVIGSVTSGGFGPTFDGPIAMGYVRADHAGEGTPVDLMVRGTPRPAKVAAMPFVPQRYYRAAK
jgi:aminomethyltransferase